MDIGVLFFCPIYFQPIHIIIISIYSWFFFINFSDYKYFLFKDLKILLDRLIDWLIDWKLLHSLYRYSEFSINFLFLLYILTTLWNILYMLKAKFWTEETKKYIILGFVCLLVSFYDLEFESESNRFLLLLLLVDWYYSLLL